MMIGKRFSLQVAKSIFNTLSIGFLLSIATYTNAYAIDMNIGTPNVATMLINISKVIPELMRLVTALAYVMGFFFIVKGVLELKSFGEARSMMSGESHLSKPVTYLFVGAMLIFVPTSVRTGMATFWTDPNPYGYLTDNTDTWSELTNSAFMVIQLVGVIAFIRGLLILNSTSGQGGQPGTFGRALAHIIAGVLCINLYQFLQAIFATLGLGTIT